MPEQNQTPAQQQLTSEPVEVRNAQGDIFLTLHYRKDYVFAKWHGHLVSEDIIQAANAFLMFVKAYPCSKLLNDKTEITGDWEEANDWLEFEWMPAAVAAGLRCMAHVHSHSMITSFSEHDLIKRAVPELQLGEFTELEAAEKWLEQCNAGT